MSIKDLQQLCFKGFYMYTLLADVYKFESEEQWSNLHFGTSVSQFFKGMNVEDIGFPILFLYN